MKTIDDLLWWMASHDSQLSVESKKGDSKRVVNVKLQLDTRHSGSLIHIKRFIGEDVLPQSKYSVLKDRLLDMIIATEAMMGEQDAKVSKSDGFHTGSTQVDEES